MAHPARGEVVRVRQADPAGRLGQTVALGHACAQAGPHKVVHLQLFNKKITPRSNLKRPEKGNFTKAIAAHLNFTEGLNLTQPFSYVRYGLHLYGYGTITTSM